MTQANAADLKEIQATLERLTDLADECLVTVVNAVFETSSGVMFSIYNGSDGTYTAGLGE